MKRLCAIFFLNLVVLNAVGCYGLLLLIEQQLATPILQRIESNANELGGNLIFAIPLQLPYAAGAEEYVEVDGEIIYGGEVYHLVKQKFYHDILYIVCIKDDQSSKSRAVLADYTRIFSGQQAETTDSNIKMMNALSKVYTIELVSCEVETKGWQAILDIKEFQNLYRLETGVSIFNPPRRS